LESQLKPPQYTPKISPNKPFVDVTERQLELHC